jgi:hypothetical protein
MKTPVQSTKEFWITNISNKAISLADLGICIYPMRSINLLDKNHYRHITEEQLTKSASSGSLFTKNKYVVVRKVAPGAPMKTIIPLQENAVFQTRQRSAIEFEKISYDELNISDEEYAEENADIAEENHSGKWIKQ